MHLRLLFWNLPNSAAEQFLTFRKDGQNGFQLIFQKSGKGNTILSLSSVNYVFLCYRKKGNTHKLLLTEFIIKYFERKQV